ncbi:polygalacturonase [Paenibacillus phyllosphaerae]|uniref:Polygalacturonase n=1 Tax=Paenibacillus phyllosphaerae TaxID=274593 RepID=A0A7W5B2Q7_9BACL|nr:glycoside hydrolase family 28 protein [Paenibacillus phyllosphaerae]MBB3113359.1 polygalacturonase [Paenibacillus phyllosphaerae]
MIAQQATYPTPELPVIPDRTFHLHAFVPAPDPLALCTEALQQAIDTCSEAGGGTVVIPPGIWRSGPLRLRSRLRLHAEEGALILFEPEPELYPLTESQYEGETAIRCQAPLDGEDLEDIAFTGGGVYDGGGQGWRPVKRFKLTVNQWSELVKSGGVLNEAGDMWWPSTEAMNGEALVRSLREQGVNEPDVYLPARTFLRPALLSIRGSKRVRLEGPTFQNSPAWCLHLHSCEQVTVRNLNVRNPWYSQNGDGLDLDSCRHALVEHSTFDVGDDAICLKSGKDEEGRRRALPTEYVTIRHCTVYHGHGGIVIGSEMSGGVRAVRASDCQFMNTDIGLRFKSARGRGGIVEDIVMERIRMHGIQREAVSFHLFYAGVEGSEGYEEAKHAVSEETPVFRDITLRDLSCVGAETALLINGLPELPLSRLTVDGFEAETVRGVVGRNADQLKLARLKLRTAVLPEVQLTHCTLAEMIEPEDRRE